MEQRAEALCSMLSLPPSHHRAQTPGGYSSQASGRGQPETIRVMLRQSRHSRSFSHFSTASPGAYRMDSCRETSCSVRAAPHNTHAHDEKQLLDVFCLKEQGKCSTFSMSPAHIDTA